MKIVLKDVPVKGIDKKIESTVYSVLEKAKVLDQIEGYTVTAEVLVNIHVAGAEEPKHLFTDRMLFGKPEILTVLPEFDENNRLVGTEDNRDISFEAVANDLSKELPEVAVPSQFNIEDLELMSVTTAGDLAEKVYKHKDGFTVIQYERTGVGLVGELTATPKEGQ